MIISAPDKGDACLSHGQFQLLRQTANHSKVSPFIQ